MKKILVVALMTCVSAVKAQDSTKTNEQNPISFSGYIEAYYAYDFGDPGNHTRPGFNYSHNRHNEVTLNLGFLKAAYQKNNIRANLALMTGTYANANLAAEPGVLKNIFEANAGVKISRKKSIWIDAGIFSSHIGFESVVSKDCWTLTRSILADNSPYYEAGAKISYTSDNGKLFLSGLILNGWQRIQRPDGNNTPAFGHQLTYKPNDRITLNSSSFIGNDKPDSLKQMRYFHNFYGIFQITKKFGLITGFDIGAEQEKKGSSAKNCWYSPVLILKISPSEKTSIAARAEYYSDQHGVIINSGTPNGFKTWGYSANFDYLLRDNAFFRIEFRGFDSKDKIFTKSNNAVSHDNQFITTSLAVSF